MADRSWFFASQGQQKGPFPEAKLRELIAAGVVTAATLVWTEGMVNWQQAGEIPGLGAGASGPPAMPRPSGPPASGGSYGGEALSIDLGLWSFFGRSLVFMIGILLVIPAPWAATSFYRWFASRVRVPGRPNFAFTGRAGDIWYVFVAMGLITYAGLSDVRYLQYVLIPVQMFLSWLIVRWAAANSQLERTTPCNRVQGWRARLYWLESADLFIRYYYRRLGVGHDRVDAMDLPQR